MLCDDDVARESILKFRAPCVFISLIFNIILSIFDENEKSIHELLENLLMVVSMWRHHEWCDFPKF